jgi:ABC-type phosphate/phosphonate transport system substrate-binding protein
MIFQTQNQSSTRRQPSRMAWSAFILVLGLIGFSRPMPCAGEEPQPQSDRSVFRIGFSSMMFSDVNKNDAKAAVKAWAQTVARERGIETDSDPSILTGLDELAAALRNKQVDMVALLAEEYRALNAAVPLAPLFMAYLNGKVEEEVVLLVHRDSGIESVEDLKGRRLIIHRNPRASLAVCWLDLVLLEKGLRQTAKFLGRVDENNKLSSVVLPVFFRQSDACLVTRSGFDTMSELNPQLGKALKVLAVSPKMVPTLLCFRADYAPTFKDKIFAGLRDLHLSPAGQQVLTIFHSEKLEEGPASALQSALDLLAHREKLREAAEMGPTTGRVTQAGLMAEGRP